MPELPETETIARDLDRELRGARIMSAVVHRVEVLRGVSPSRLSKRLTGALVAAVWRRAKIVVIELGTSDRLAVQPRFTGALLVNAPPGDQYAALAFSLTDGRTLTYRDVRRLGTVALLRPGAWAALEAGLGPEPLDPALDGSRFSRLLAASRRPIKVRLMDQRALAGIGNIYATEALWRAGIDPSRAAASVSTTEAVTLLRALREILSASIAARGTTFRDYRDAYGGRGGYAAHLQAYGRAGEPCARCGHPLAGTSAIDGRMTAFCAWCQR
ncbi:MAG: bifunctional DNA-formamidopyrimidine glycosylase/DNA-(apurinic or apyrimidinic site) lyase [Gemmatimonadetes bacterium]|nr:bifunctional DNA-formamidopyrimidine glycosylase/DNA-(apurinic or apyrimidinic site) lyase [Gemmatimonadota bacterium]